VARPAVFLDRDGVLNDVRCVDGRPHPPRTVAELRILDGVPEGCAALRQAGYLLVVVTNQPDIARGTATRAEVDAINQAVVGAVAADAVRTCPHDDADACRCRKPEPGLLLDAARELDLDLSASWMVGDRWRDVAAGRAAGCRTVWLDRGYREPAPTAPDAVAPSLPAASRLILAAARTQEVARP